MPKLDPPTVARKRAAPPRAEAAGQEFTRIDWRQVSHELRTPLNAILGNAELLLDGSAGPLSAQARTCLGEVQRAGQELLRQVRLLLARSELRAGGPRLTGPPLDLMTLLRETLTSAGASAARIEPDDARLVVAGDPFWLRMLLAEITGLGESAGGAPRVALARHAGRATLRFAWPGFRAEPMPALRIALIEAIAGAHGAAVARDADGLALHWPAERPDAS